MATYILLTKLSSEGLGDLHKREAIGRKWFDAVKAETWAALPYKRFLKVVEEM